MIVEQCADLNVEEDRETFLSIISKTFTVYDSPEGILVKGELVRGRDYEPAPGFTLPSYFEIRDGDSRLIIDGNTVFVNTPDGSYEFVLLNEVKPEYSDPVLKIRYSGERSGVKCYDLNRQEDVNGVLESLKEAGFDTGYDRVYRTLWVKGELVQARIYDNPEISIRKDNTEIMVRNLVKAVELRVIRDEPGSEVRVFYLYPNVKVSYFKPFLEMKVYDR
jgi:hypothetical protein